MRVCNDITCQKYNTASFFYDKKLKKTMRSTAKKDCIIINHSD